MRANLIFYSFLLVLAVASTQVGAYFNATYLATTVFLTNSTTAHVVESTQLLISNDSMATYNQYRQAFDLSLDDWRRAIDSPFLRQHVLNPKGSISNFTFLPGPIVPTGITGGYASLTMSYDASNVTDVMAVAPRKFEYTFNSSAFNFLHTASGQSLLGNARLTFTLPVGTEIIAVYPLPDYPQPNSVGKYNSTTFSWFSGEPLQQFSFTYLMTETPQQEVLQYFSELYSNYTMEIYGIVALIIVSIATYIYIKVFR
jgi:hypothetical protein